MGPRRSTSSTRACSCVSRRRCDSAGAGCSGACQVTTRRRFTVQGAGIAGVLIADPCFTSASITSLVGCTYGQKYQARHAQQPLPPRHARVRVQGPQASPVGLPLWLGAAAYGRACAHRRSRGRRRSSTRSCKTMTRTSGVSSVRRLSGCPARSALAALAHERYTRRLHRRHGT